MRVCVTIPVYNEAPDLHDNMGRLHDFLSTRWNGLKWELVIANNGSTDRTPELGKDFARTRDGVRIVHLAEKGRGRALKEVWSRSDADILSYMDADLSSGLGAFPQLIEAVATGGYDLATGSRLLRPEWTTRSVKREVVSRCYNFMVRAILNTGFSDAQCGFKAITRRAASQLLPQVEDDHWFFDTELLVIAERSGYRIFDLPVRWSENRKSHVSVLSTAWSDVKGLVRLRRKMNSQANHRTRGANGK